MRRHFITSHLTDFCPHDHVAWCGDGQDALDRVALSAFSNAEKRGELMIFVSEHPDPSRLAALDNFEVLTNSGALQLQTVESTYPKGDVNARLGMFERLIDEALADGYPGVCIVADDSSLVQGNQEDFAAWLAWESAADRLQANRPVRGVCFFDRKQVPPDRLADLSAMHPILSTGFEAPSFRLFVDGDTVRVVGVLDSWCAHQLRRILSSAPSLTEMVLDLSQTEFIDHRALLVLNEVANDGHAMRLRGAKAIVRRVWELLEERTPALEFC